MSNFIIVETEARLGKVYLSQMTLEGVTEALHAHPGLNMFAVYELRVNPGSSQTAPSGCVGLRSVAYIFPQDRTNYHRCLLAQQMEKLPLDQFLLEHQKTLDHLSEIKTKLERAAEQPELFQPPKTGETNV